jgi:hypothetical protein
MKGVEKKLERVFSTTSGLIFIPPELIIKSCLPFQTNSLSDCKSITSFVVIGASKRSVL